MHGRHKTGRTRKGVQKREEPQGSNQNGCRPHGACAQHFSVGDCQPPSTLSHVGPRLAALLRRRRPRRPPGSSPMRAAQKNPYNVMGGIIVNVIVCCIVRPTRNRAIYTTSQSRPACRLAGNPDRRRVAVNDAGRFCRHGGT